MNIELHYAGTIYNIVGDEDRATEIVKEIRSTIADGGGTVALDTADGSINFVIGRDIPTAIVLKPKGHIIY